MKKDFIKSEMAFPTKSLGKIVLSIVASGVLLGSGLTSSDAFADTFTIGTGTAVNPPAGYPTPMGNYYYGNRTQYLYEASELLTAGLNPGTTITQLGFDIQNLNSMPDLDNFSIYLKNSTASDMSSWETSVNLVYGPIMLTVASLTAGGFNMFTLNNSFVWDGASNIVVEVCSNNNFWTSSGNASVAYTTTTTSPSARYYRADNGTVCSSALQSGVSAKRANVRFEGTLGAPISIDAAVTGVSMNATYESGNPMTINVDVTNNGIDPISGTVNFDIDNNGSDESTGNAFSSLAGGATTTVEVNTNAPNALGNYTGKATVVVANDGLSANDSGTASYSVVPGCVTTYPYAENFDNNTDFPPSTSKTGTTPSITTGWIATGSVKWAADTGTTPSSGTGPTGDHTTGSGYYLYTESSGNANATQVIYSPCFDISTLTAPQLSFWYHMFGATMGSIIIDIVDENLASIATDVFTLTGQQQAATSDPWLEASVSLTAYKANSPIRVCFRGVTGTSFTSDMAFDDVLVGEAPSVDVGVTNVIVNEPVFLGLPATASVDVKNNGAEKVSGTVNFDIDNDGNDDVIGVAFTDLGAGLTTTVTVNFTAPGTTGPKTGKATAIVAGDGNPLNNSGTDGYSVSDADDVEVTSVTAPDVSVGNTIDISVDVTNNGADAANIDVSVDVTNDGFPESTQSITGLASGVTQTVNFNGLTAPAGEGSYTASATVTQTDAADTNNGNNTGTASYSVIPAGTVVIGTGTATNTSTSYPTPLGNWFWGNRTQYLYEAAELIAVGVNPGDIISNVGFYIENLNAMVDLENFTISLKNTSAIDMSVWDTGTTVVYGPTILPAASLSSGGWNLITLDSPFAWDGASNLTVEVCSNNSAFTQNASVRYTTTALNPSARYYRFDAAGVCSNTSQTGFSANRANLMLSANAPGPGGSAPTISHTPISSNTEGNSATVSADITDVDNDLVSTGGGAPTLWYRVNGGAFSSVSMTTSAPSSQGIVDVKRVESKSKTQITSSKKYNSNKVFAIFSADIPSQTANDLVEYYIAAQDGDSNVKTSPNGGSGTTPPGSTPPGNLFSYTVDPPPPANDDCANATEITSWGSQITGSTVQATEDAGQDQSCAGGGSTNKTVWYKFTISANETWNVSFDLSGSSFDTAMELFSGNCGTLLSIQCDDDGGTGTTSRIPANSGTIQLGTGDYQLMISGYAANSGNYTLQPNRIQVLPPATNGGAPLNDGSNPVSTGGTPIVDLILSGGANNPTGITVTTQGGTTPSGFDNGVSRTFNIQTVGGNNFTTDLKFYFLASEAAPGMVVGGTAKVWRRDGLNWVEVGTGPVVNEGGNPEWWSVTVVGVPSAAPISDKHVANLNVVDGDFGIGNEFDIPLFIELSYFKVAQEKETAVLSWGTESEVDNIGFEIYRKDSEKADFKLIASYRTHDELKGAGNSSLPIDYSFVDNNVAVGKTYTYKLVDIDADLLATEHETVSLTIDYNKATVIDRFVLRQNFPNPFNPETTISFEVPNVTTSMSRVEISIFNIKGQVVRNLVNQAYSGGLHSVVWDGKDDGGKSLASGVYFLKLKTNDTQLSRKMLLLK